MNNFSNCSTFADSQMKRSSQSEASTPSQNCRGGQNLVHSLPEGSFLFIPPCRYVFKGAELSPNDSDDMDSSSSSSSSDSESDGDADEDTPDLSNNVNSENNTTSNNNPSLSVPQ